MMRLVVDTAMQDWFRAHYGEMTEIQRRLWERLPQAEHILAISPTGSGKTMAIFFPVLLELLRAQQGAEAEVRGEPAYGGITVLYISPLKALNTDMQRNLLKPLEGLRAYFQERGENVNPVRIAVRSGDSTPRERKAVETNPPQILATTPESVQILLLSRHAKRLLSSVRLIIIDEIHAIAGTKRGAHLFALLELLEELSPGMRRAALSATVRDEEECARLLGGYDARGRARPISRVKVPAGAPRHIQLEWPVFPTDGLGGNLQTPKDTLARMGPAFRRIIEENRTTLFFVNSRRLAERMASLINREFETHVASAHHGSLSRELRLAVEGALKQGTLRAVVATASLELGIDIGQLDAVVLVGTPFGVAQAIQRTGRAAHHPGGEGRVTLFPTHARDALEALALSAAVERQELERLITHINPLDILAQFVLTASVAQERTSDWLYSRARSAAPFASLEREDFEKVLWMLAGIVNGRRHDALPARASYDGSTFAAGESTLFLLRTAGGTIPARPGLMMRDAESKAVLGELEEMFVWERRIGEIFRFANRSWRYVGQDEQGILVTQWKGAEGLMPFWIAESADSSDEVLAELHALLDKIHEDYEGKILEPLRERAGAAGWNEALHAELVKYIEAHRLEERFALPDSRTLVCEEIRNDAMPGRTFCLLTARGGRINRALSFALSAWAGQKGYTLHLHLDNDCILISGLPGGRGAEAFLMEFFQGFDQELVMQGLYKSRHFGLYFRDAAARALVLPRDLPGRVRPFWKFRARAQALLANLAGEGDMPLFREAARECVQEVLDITGAMRLAEDVLAQKVALFCYAHDAPSPMAQGVLWARTNELLYADDAPLAAVRSPELPRGVIGEEALLALDFRLEGIYLKKDQEESLLLTNAEDLMDWLRVRILVSGELWRKALALSGIENISEIEFLQSAQEGEPDFVACLADLPIIKSIQSGDENAPGHLSQWLRYRGPESRAEIAKIFRADEGIISALIDMLVESEQVCNLEDGRVLCRENLDFALRQARNIRRQEVQSVRTLTDIPLFTAAAQGVYDSLSGVDGLAMAIERLFACAIPAELWESEILPLRIADYRPALLDELFAEGDLLWISDEKKRIAIFPKTEVCAYRDFPERGPSWEGVLPDPERFYSFEELLRHNKADSAGLSARLWQEVFEGKISNTAWSALRSGIAGSFGGGGARAPAGAQVGAGSGAGTIPGRASFMRWRSGRPDGGYWFAAQMFPARAGREGNAQGEHESNALAEHLRMRARLELLFQRWGIVSREIVQGCGLFPSWHRVYRELVRMEMEGQIAAGRYFIGLGGVQFMPCELLPVFEHLEKRAGKPFLASFHDPIFPPIPKLWQGIRRAGHASVLITGHGVSAVLSAGGKRLVLYDAAQAAPGEIADVLFQRVRARMRTLTIREIQGPGREGVIAALLERGARLCAPGSVVELNWRL
jgi:ATP-dependent Lhr-like helicase